MTLRNSPAGVVLLLLVFCPALAGAAQRAAARVPPSDSGGGSAADAPKAQPREAEARKAEPRPAEARAAEAPAAKPSIQLPAREDSHRAISVVVPAVVVPSSVGGVTVGQAFSAGNAFAVGHTTPETESSPSRGGGGRRHDRSDYVDSPVETVFVPVPIYVPIAESATTEPTESELVPDRPADRSGDIARDERDPRGVRRTRGYFTFSPWYDISAGIMAGYPVVLPPPSTFEEGNVSSTVAETRRENDGDNVRISVLEYAKGVGGVAFAIQPADTAVFVDGRFVGSASDYSPQQEPLLLRFGVYTVELRANGYVTERFPVYVKMGEVTPFSGTMTKLEP